MKILFITNELPYPPDRNGFTKNMFNTLKFINKISDNKKIDLLYLSKSNKKDRKGLNELNKIVDEINIFKIRHSKYIRFSKLLFPFNFGLRYYYDIYVYCNFLCGYTKANFSNRGNHILFAADSRTLFYSTFKNFRYKIKYYQYKFEQRQVFKRFDKIIFVSQKDLDEVLNYLPKRKGLLTIPLGVNIDEYKDINNSNKEHDLIFTGNFNFRPNLLTALYILKELLPLFLKAKHDIKICLAGRNPNKEILNISKKYKKNVLVTEEVPSIIPYLFKSKVYISPVFFGAGMKTKILEAMAAKLPIIASKESIVGFSQIDNFIIPTNNNDWIEKSMFIISNPRQAKKIGLVNYNIVKSEYSFEKIIENYWLKIFENK